jgi:integrase
MTIREPLVFPDQAGGYLRGPNVARRSFHPLIDQVNKREARTAEQERRTPRPLPRLRFHDLRHTAATLLLLAGENPKVVSERLGHATVTITRDTYSHVLPTMQKAAAARLDRLFG